MIIVKRFTNKITTRLAKMGHNDLGLILYVVICWPIAGLSLVTFYDLVTCGSAGSTPQTKEMCSLLMETYPNLFEWLARTPAGTALAVLTFVGIVLFHLYAYYAALRDAWRFLDWLDLKAGEWDQRRKPLSN